MSENPSGLEFDRKEFQPLRALSFVIAASRCVGAGVSPWVVQRRVSPDSLVVCRRPL
jgi:hypothetical protein